LDAVYALGQAGIFLNDRFYIELAARTFQLCAESVVWNDGDPSLVVDGQPAGLLGLLELVRFSGASYANAEAMSPLIDHLIERLLQPDGRVSQNKHPGQATEDHDFLPGYAIHSLAEGMQKWPNRTHLDRLRVSLEWYRRRASHVKGWGMVGWLPRACASLHSIAPDPSLAAFAFDLVEWALARQVEKTGAFLVDLAPWAPSFHTAYVGEAVAACWRLAIESGSERMADACANSWWRAMEFTDQLVIGPQDLFLMKDRTGRGGVRMSYASSEIRSDFVGHALQALVDGAAAQGMRTNFGDVVT
jgi:hypothetical protein